MVDRYASAEAEVRSILLAKANDDVLFVVFTERNDRIRLISAQKALRNEKDLYYHENGA